MSLPEDSPPPDAPRRMGLARKFMTLFSKRSGQASESMRAAETSNAWQQLQINLSGTRLNLGQGRRRGKRKDRQRPISLDRFEVIAHPLRLQDADLHFDVQAKNVRLYPAGQDDPPASPRVDFAAGRIALRIAPEDIEALLVVIVQELLREYRITIPRTDLLLVAPTPRALDADLTIRARRCIVVANLHVAAQLVVDDDYIARLTRLQVTGHGIVGRLLAHFARPRAQRLQAQQWSLDAFTPRGITLKDIEFSVTDVVGIRVEFDPHLSPERETEKTKKGRSNMVGSVTTPKVAKTAEGSHKGRLEIFVIDSGWNENAKRMLDQHFALFESFLSKHIVYHLNEQQSKLLLEQNPTMIGQDPVLVVLDNDARIESPRHGYGCRLSLGAMQPDKLSERLKRFMQILSDRSKTKTEIVRQIRKEGTKEGFDGAMELIGEIVRPE